MRVTATSSLPSRTLLTGAVGSLLLDWGGWQSVFYFSGGLTLLWVCYVHRYLLKGKGNWSRSGWSWSVLPCRRQQARRAEPLRRARGLWLCLVQRHPQGCSLRKTIQMQSSQPTLPRDSIHKPPCLGLSRQEAGR